MKPLIERLRTAASIHGDDELTDRLAVELRNAAHDGHPHCPTTLCRDLAGALIALEAVIDSPLPEVQACHSGSSMSPTRVRRSTRRRPPAAARLPTRTPGRSPC